MKSKRYKSISDALADLKGVTLKQSKKHMRKNGNGEINIYSYDSAGKENKIAVKVGAGKAMTRTEELEQENAALRRENAKLKKDKQRLDFVGVEGISIYRWAGGWNTSKTSNKCNMSTTIRAAIDAAMKEQKNEKK